MMKIYCQPNGGISFIPDIQDLGDLKIFGCSTPADYNDGAVLYNSTPNAPTVIVQEIEIFHPDFVFIETFSPLMVAGLQRVRTIYKRPIVGFWGDCVTNAHTLNVLARAGRYCDLLLVVDKPAELALRAKGVNAEFTLQPAAGSIYKYEPDAKKIYDLVMAGNPYTPQRKTNATQRVELARLFSKRPGFAVFGREDWFKYGIDTKGWVNEYKLAKIYNQTKIVLSCDYIIDRLYFTSVRTYNVMCCGAFLLIRKFLGIEDLFVNKKHLVWYETNEEAEMLVDYYLAHEEERQEIAHAGMEYVHQKALKHDLFSMWMSRVYNSQCKQLSAVTRMGDSFWLMGNYAKSSLLQLVQSCIVKYLRRKIG